MPRHDKDAMPRTHEQRFSWSKQVEFEVPPTTVWQPDRLAQRELFDEKTRPHVPDYDSISLVVQNGILYDYYPAKKYHFDGMLGPNVPAELRARLWDPVDDTSLRESLEEPMRRSGCGLSSHGETASARTRPGGIPAHDTSKLPQGTVGHTASRAQPLHAGGTSQQSRHNRGRATKRT